MCPHEKNPSAELFITVAALGPVPEYLRQEVFAGESFDDQGWKLRYADRKKVTVQAAGHEYLGLVIDRAADAFGVRSRTEQTVGELVPYVAFYLEQDELEFVSREERWESAIRTVGPDGSASWAVRWSAITIDELLASADAGLLDGDPLRVFLWPVIPQGEVANFVVALWQLWALWEHALSGRETVGLARTVLSRIRRGREASEEAGRPWIGALQRPQDLFPFLDAAPRSTAEVACFTGLSKEQAEGALWALGYASEERGWVPGGDPAAGLLRSQVMRIRERGTAADVVDIAEQVRAVVEAADRGPGTSRNP
jgi:hypothetical protein